MESVPHEDFTTNHTTLYTRCDQWAPASHVNMLFTAAPRILQSFHTLTGLQSTGTILTSCFPVFEKKNQSHFYFQELMTCFYGYLSAAWRIKGRVSAADTKAVTLQENVVWMAVLPQLQEDSFSTITVIRLTWAAAAGRSVNGPKTISSTGFFGAEFHQTAVHPGPCSSASIRWCATSGDQNAPHPKKKKPSANSLMYLSIIISVTLQSDNRLVT